MYNYYRDELSDDADNNQFNNIKVVNSKTFKYENKIIDNTNNAGIKDIELAIPLKSRQLLESTKYSINKL